MRQNITVGIVDDHQLVIDGLKSMLQQEGFIITLTANNGQELISLLTRIEDYPDCILLDIRMPKMDGYETIKHLKYNYNAIKIIILTVFDSNHSRDAMLKSGADGYLLKSSSIKEISETLYSLYDKNTVKRSQRFTFNETISDLTHKELQLLKLVGSSYTYQDISQKMHMSISAIEKCQYKVCEKLGIKNNRTTITSFVNKTGLDL